MIHGQFIARVLGLSDRSLTCVALALLSHVIPIHSQCDPLCERLIHFPHVCHIKAYNQYQA